MISRVLRRMRSFRLGSFSTVVVTAVFAFSLVDASAQELNPIHWSVKKENPASAVKAGDKFNSQVIATIDEGWHLYSLEQPAGGPITTHISVPENQKFKLVGDIESPLPQVLFDPNFNMDTQFYEGEAVFKLPVEIAKDAEAGKNTLFVNLFFQTCNDQTCLPPKTVKLNTEIEVAGGPLQVSNSSAASSVQKNVPQPVPASQRPNDEIIDFDFVDFNGKQRKFSEFRGKHVLLDFWATWCKPCLADIPHLKELFEKYRDKGFEIIGMDSETLSADEEVDKEFAKETDERARNIVKTRGASWTHATSETAVPVAVNVFNVESLPTKILINPQGKIVARIKDAKELDEILAALLGANK
jgi:thiol-disulfide isomerase/thioredoxin